MNNLHRIPSDELGHLYNLPCCMCKRGYKPQTTEFLPATMRLTLECKAKHSYTQDVCELHLAEAVIDATSQMSCCGVCWPRDTICDVEDIDFHLVGLQRVYQGKPLSAEIIAEWDAARERENAECLQQFEETRSHRDYCNDWTTAHEPHVLNCPGARLASEVSAEVAK